MGVYIEGLDMPTSCGECHDSGLWSVISYLCKGGCFDDYSGCCAIGQAGCPLVEVKTPHGRLIDADIALKSEQPSAVTDEQWSKTTLARCIKNAPTVIESEGNDED